MTGSIVNFKSNGNTLQGYLTVAREGKGPGIIVIQEW